VGTSGSATVLSGDLRRSILKLKAQRGETIGVHGSPSLVRSLIRNSLLDSLHLFQFPIVAVAGDRLFEGEFPSQRMKVIDLIRNQNGVLALTYRPTGRPWDVPAGRSGPPRRTSPAPPESKAGPPAALGTLGNRPQTPYYELDSRARFSWHVDRSPSRALIRWNRRAAS
jgi:hypothetical protein